HGRDQLDHELRETVAGRRLAAENEGARDLVAAYSALQAVVDRDDVQDVQMLALVLVDALDLNVEQRVRVQGRLAVDLREVFRELGLVGTLDRGPTLAERRVLRKRFERAQLVE